MTFVSLEPTITFLFPLQLHAFDISSIGGLIARHLKHCDTLHCLTWSITWSNPINPFIMKLLHASLYLVQGRSSCWQRGLSNVTFGTFRYSVNVTIERISIRLPAFIGMTVCYVSASWAITVLFHFSVTCLREVYGRRSRPFVLRTLQETHKIASFGLGSNWWVKMILWRAVHLTAFAPGVATCKRLPWHSAFAVRGLLHLDPSYGGWSAATSPAKD